MATIFTKIVNGDIPCYKVAETNSFLAFLDINPNTKGHTLCIPKMEIDKVFDLDKKKFLELMDFSRRVAVAIEKSIDCKRVGMSVIGLEVPHAHIHLIPITTMDDMNFSRPKLSPSQDELVDMAKLISANFN